MLVIGLFNVAFTLFSWLFSLFPQTYPAVIDDAIIFLNYYLSQGVAIVKFYYPVNYFSIIIPFLLNFLAILLSIAIIKKVIMIIPILDIKLNDGNEH